MLFIHLISVAFGGQDTTKEYHCKTISWQEPRQATGLWCSLAAAQPSTLFSSKNSCHNTLDPLASVSDLICILEGWFHSLVVLTKAQDKSPDVQGCLQKLDNKVHHE